jgi:hypothetical protein
VAYFRVFSDAYLNRNQHDKIPTTIAAASASWLLGTFLALLFVGETSLSRTGIVELAALVYNVQARPTPFGGVYILG